MRPPLLYMCSTCIYVIYVLCSYRIIVYNIMEHTPRAYYTVSALTPPPSPARTSRRPVKLDIFGPLRTIGTGRVAEEILLMRSFIIYVITSVEKRNVASVSNRQ